VSNSGFSENVVTAMMTGSITGAGLVIAFYALIANMSEKVFAHRFERLGRYRQEIKRISSDPESFNEKNLQETNSRLEKLRKKTDSLRTFPMYLGLGIGLDFVFFIMTAFASYSWLVIDPTTRSEMFNVFLVVLFDLAIILFICVGIFGISDILTTLWANFNKLKSEKEKIKAEIEYAPKGAEISGNIMMFLNKMNISFETNVVIKSNGKILMPDFIIPSKKRPKYSIEVKIKPTSQNVYTSSLQFEDFKEQTGVKTILISDFEDKQSVLRAAKGYWNYVLDLKELDKLREIIGIS
jgi:hypothetical protein